MGVCVCVYVCVCGGVVCLDVCVCVGWVGVCGVCVDVRVCGGACVRIPIVGMSVCAVVV